MGSPLTVALAEVRVTNVESLALALPPSLYKHFVDDGVSRYRDRQHAESFLEHLNSLSDDLVYIIEHPALDGTLPFLDILLHPDLSTSVYRKPTHTDSYTHYSTSSPQSTKDSLIRSLTLRAYDICSPQHLPHELEHIYTVLLDNGYPLSRIEPSNPLIIQHLHPLSRISNLLKSLYRTIRMSTSKLAASCNGTQFLQHAPPIRIFVTFSPALSLVNQHCTPVTSYIKSHAKTARPHIADRHLDPCTNAFRSIRAILDLHIVMPQISSSHQH